MSNTFITIVIAGGAGIVASALLSYLFPQASEYWGLIVGAVVTMIVLSVIQ